MGEDWAVSGQGLRRGREVSVSGAEVAPPGKNLRGPRNDHSSQHQWPGERRRRALRSSSTTTRRGRSVAARRRSPSSGSENPGACVDRAGPRARGRGDRLGLPRGCSSAGRAPPWHGGGQGFEPPQLHSRGLGARLPLSSVEDSHQACPLPASAAATLPDRESLRQSVRMVLTKAGLIVSDGPRQRDAVARGAHRLALHRFPGSGQVRQRRVHAVLPGHRGNRRFRGDPDQGAVGAVAGLRPGQRPGRAGARAAAVAPLDARRRRPPPAARRCWTWSWSSASRSRSWP